MFPVRASRFWVWNLMHKWGWSFKDMKYVANHKFTAENLSYYGQYVVAVQRLPWIRLHFLDEAHFASKGSRSARKSPRLH